MLKSPPTKIVLAIIHQHRVGNNFIINYPMTCARGKPCPGPQISAMLPIDGRCSDLTIENI